jgi:chorismate mutase
MTHHSSHTDDDARGSDGTDDQEPRADRGVHDHRDVLADGGSHDDRGTGEQATGRVPAPDEMSLDELRDEIRGIDHDLVELIARRTYVADTIAQVKDERDLPTTDEEQEQRVMDRAGANAETYDVDANLVKAIFRLLIELNKVEQRESR